MQQNIGGQLQPVHRLTCHKYKKKLKDHKSNRDGYLKKNNKKIKIISQFCRIGKDCDQNSDRMSENDEKLPYLH